MRANSKAHTASPPETYDDESANDGFCSALLLQQNSTKRHDKQIFLGVFDDYGAESHRMAHYARNDIAIKSREAVAILTISSHLQPPTTQ